MTEWWQVGNREQGTCRGKGMGVSHTLPPTFSRSNRQFFGKSVKFSMTMIACRVNMTLCSNLSVDFFCYTPSLPLKSFDTPLSQTTSRTDRVGNYSSAKTSMYTQNISFSESNIMFTNCCFTGSVASIKCEIGAQSLHKPT